MAQEPMSAASLKLTSESLRSLGRGYMAFEDLKRFLGESGPSPPVRKLWPRPFEMTFPRQTKTRGLQHERLVRFRIQEGEDHEDNKKRMSCGSNEDGWGDLCYRGFSD